jgi:F0F1-type ATP synthase membrane subunit b/b'
MSIVYDYIGIWLLYIQLAIFIVFFLFVIKYFINIFKEHKKKRNEKII